MVVSSKKWGEKNPNTWWGRSFNNKHLGFNTLSHTVWLKEIALLPPTHSYGFHLSVCSGTQGDFMNSWSTRWFLSIKNNWFPFSFFTDWCEIRVLPGIRIFFLRVHIMTTADLLRLSNMQFTVLGKWTKKWLYTV